jgi:hypothetical protein
MLQIETGEPALLFAAVEVATGLLGKGQAPVHVPVLCRRLFAGFLQPLPAKRPNRFEHRPT